MTVAAGAALAATAVKAMDYDYFGKIREWANDRNLVKGSTLQAQVVKLLEESGELAAGVARNDIDRVVDSIGDIMVVLTIIAAQIDMPVEECLDLVWQEIRYRKGKMVETETKNAEVITDISKKSSDDRIKHENAVQQNKDALYKASVDLANSIIALAGEQSKTGKALALSVIAADTAMAISGALSITQKPSPDNIATGGLAGAAKYIGLAAMILSNAKKARDILKSGQASSPSPLQLSGGGFSQMSAPQVSSTLPQVNGFEQRVFVTEGDISRTQARVGNTKRVSVVK